MTMKLSDRISAEHLDRAAAFLQKIDDERANNPAGQMLIEQQQYLANILREWLGESPEAWRGAMLALDMITETVREMHDVDQKLPAQLKKLLGMGSNLAEAIGTMMIEAWLGTALRLLFTPEVRALLAQEARDAAAAG